jgi:hypothetical protein
LSKSRGRPADWRPISSAPFDQDLELSVIEEDEVHALLFPCRRTARGWVNASIKSAVSVRPTHALGRTLGIDTNQSRGELIGAELQQVIRRPNMEGDASVV